METNGENVLGVSRDALTQEIDIASQNIVSQPKVAIFLFAHPKNFSRCRPIQCSTYRALFVDALALVLSTSARKQPFSSLIRESGSGDVVW